MTYTVDTETGCWNVHATANPQSGRPNHHPHRESYVEHFGAIPDGYHVHHRCENGWCINPAHLEAMSQQDHLVLHHLTQKGLTLDDVREIYELGSKRGVCARDVAKRYGLTHWSVYYIWKGVNWRGLLGLPPVEIDAGVCARPGCSEPVTGRRDKRYCSKVCQHARRTPKRPDRLAA